MSKSLKLSAKLLRKQLASIDLRDIDELKTDEEAMGNADVLNRASNTETYYKNNLKRVLKILVQKQLEYMGKEATDENVLAFARGTINGLYLVDEWCREQSRLSVSRFDNKDEEEDIQESISPLK